MVQIQVPLKHCRGRGLQSPHYSIQIRCFPLVQFFSSVSLRQILYNTYCNDSFAKSVPIALVFFIYHIKFSTWAEHEHIFLHFSQVATSASAKCQKTAHSRTATLRPAAERVNLHKGPNIKTLDFTAEINAVYSPVQNYIKTKSST